MTHTYALIKVSPQLYQEIEAKLLAAGYDHAIDNDGVIDLHGLALKSEEGVVRESAETILEAAAGLKDAITDAKAKLLFSFGEALKVGYHMRKAQKEYFSARTGKQLLLIESKGLEAGFDRRLAELKAQGVVFEDPPF